MEIPTHVSLAGTKRPLPPIDANRGLIVGELFAEAIKGLANTLDAMEQFEALQQVVLTKEDLEKDAAKWGPILDGLGVSEEDRQLGDGEVLALAKKTNDAQRLSVILPVALKELPEAVYNIAAAMVLPAKVLAEAYIGGRIKKQVEEEAQRIRVGDDSTGWIGATFDELLDVLIVADALRKDEQERLAPKAKALLPGASQEGETEPSSPPLEITSPETSGDESTSA